MTFSYLGDQAILARLPNETTALRFTAAVRAAALPWVLDVVPAYASVAVFHDPNHIRLAAARDTLERLAAGPLPDATAAGRTHVLPCCYELGPDLDRVAAHAGLSPEETASLHAGTEYTVYAVGFCPGFPYLGYLPGPLCGVPRLATPRVRVEPGSVGLTGRQTGVYPLVRPGGWSLIGRTPLVLVDVADGYFPLQAGDRVRFERISRDEFRRLEGKRL
jgi:inhibitor of KinA